MRNDASTDVQIRRLEQAVRALTFQNYDLQKHIKGCEEHIESLVEDLADAHEHIHQMSMTRGWRTLEAIRRVAHPRR